MQANGSDAPRQAKKKNQFIVRKVPAATILDRRLSDPAFRLLAWLWVRMDAKTGALEIRGHDWSQEELVRMARKDLGISETSLRRLLCGELIPLGYVCELPRQRVEKTDKSGRKRQVFGPCRYIVARSPHEESGIEKSKRKKPRSERVSSTGQKWTLEENARPLEDSSSGHSRSLQERPDNTPSDSPSQKNHSIYTSSSLPKSTKPDEEVFSQTNPPTPKDQTEEQGQTPSYEAVMLVYGNRPKLLAWARQIILARAPHRVLYPEAYLRRALPGFLAFGLQDEAESFITQKLQNHVQQLLWQNPDRVLYVGYLCSFIEQLILELQLPKFHVGNILDRLRGRLTHSLMFDKDSWRASPRFRDFWQKVRDGTASVN